MSLVKCCWRVSGRVQGVFFRKYTKLRADQLGLSGWCQNTADGLSVEGEIFGPELKVREMLHWIEFEGSPHSHPQTLVILSWSTDNQTELSGLAEFFIKH